MRKKITLAILAGAMAMMLVGCGNDQSGSTAGTAAQTEVQTVAATEAETAAKTEAETESKTEAKNDTEKEANPSPATEEAPLVGGWSSSESPVITEEIRNLVAKANQILTGAQYEPVALISKQVVAGFNYRLLCKVTATVPDAKTYYSVITLWEDPQGEASITDIIDTAIEAPSGEQLDGGITEAASPELTAEAKEAVTKAMETMAGMSYNPLALLGTQVVAGTNYIVLCEATATVPGAETGYAIVTVCAGVDGSYSVVEAQDVKAAE